MAPRRALALLLLLLLLIAAALPWSPLSPASIALPRLPSLPLDDPSPDSTVSSSTPVALNESHLAVVDLKKTVASLNASIAPGESPLVDLVNMSEGEKGTAASPSASLARNESSKVDLIEANESQDNQVEVRFKERCWPWVEWVDQWLAVSAFENGTLADQCHYCPGLGDRLVGLVGLLNTAMFRERALRLTLPGLRKFFEPSRYLQKAYAGRWDSQIDHVRNPNCEPHFWSTAGKCKYFFSSRFSPKACHQDANLTWIMQNVNRACPKPGMCQRLYDLFPTSLSAADFVGCPLRMLLRVKPKVRTQVRFRLHVGLVEQSLSLAAIEKVFKTFYVIGVQIRLSDKFRANVTVPDYIRKRFLVDPFRCASTLQSFVEGRKIVLPRYSMNKTTPDSNSLGDIDSLWTAPGGRPVRWFVMSNNAQVLAHARKEFGSRVITFDAMPRHISSDLLEMDEAQRLDQESELMAMWYALGLSESLIMSEDDAFLRPSALGFTAWLYALKHFWYRSSTCEMQTLLTTNNALQLSCNTTLEWEPNQPHLMLNNGMRKVMFDHGEWVLRDRLVRL